MPLSFGFNKYMLHCLDEKMCQEYNYMILIFLDHSEPHQ